MPRPGLSTTIGKCDVDQLTVDNMNTKEAAGLTAVERLSQRIGEYNAQTNLPWMP